MIRLLIKAPFGDAANTVYSMLLCDEKNTAVHAGFKPG
jgi:hypothetical protein